MAAQGLSGLKLVDTGNREHGQRRPWRQERVGADRSPSRGQTGGRLTGAQLSVGMGKGPDAMAPRQVLHMADTAC